MDHPDVTPELIQAYRETVFELQQPTPLALRIGEPADALRVVHAKFGVSESCFVTAYNPRSELLTDDENAARHRALCEELRASRRTFFVGEGGHPTGSWPKERGVLVLGLTEDDARALGHRWDQNAVVWSGADAVPRLLVLRGTAQSEAP